MARHTEATEITIALRTPTLAYPCQPFVKGIVTPEMISFGKREFLLGPTMNSAKGTDRLVVSDSK